MAPRAVIAVFQFTLPCRERRIDVRVYASDPVFQFTLPCRERPKAELLSAIQSAVSIHAPV